MDASQIITIATLVGGVGIALSYFIGKAVGGHEQTEKINNKQTWIDYYEHREEIYQKGILVDATITELTAKRASLEFHIRAYWYSDTGEPHEIEDTFSAYENFAEVSQKLSYIHSVTVFVLSTEEYPYYSAIMKRPW